MNGRKRKREFGEKEFSRCRNRYERSQKKLAVRSGEKAVRYEKVGP
jgi:hypothetical protein